MLRRLPQGLKRLAVGAAVLVLAIILTVVRHNASTYLTGVWDTGSQCIVFGRLLQIEQGQQTAGGFLGVYTQEWDDIQNRDWFRSNTPTDPADFQAYTHQSGLQGWAMGWLNRLLRHWQPDGEARERTLYAVNSTLFYAAELLLCLAVYKNFGLLPGAAWLAATLLAPWLQRGMKDLYWCLWTWLLPLLAVLLLMDCTRRQGRTPAWCYFAVALACMARCMCGFEFISVFLILCEIPLCAAASADWACRDRPGAAAWLRRAVGTGLSALGGVAAALALWFAQLVWYYGGTAGAWANMREAITTRLSVTDASVRDVTVGQVLRFYFLENQEPVLQIGPLAITILPLLAAVVLGFAICGFVLARRGQVARLLPLAVIWLLSVAAPVSWMVLSKAHSIIHTHLLPMLWHFAAVPASCMVLAAMAALLVTTRDKVREKHLVASH